MQKGSGSVNADTLVDEAVFDVETEVENVLPVERDPQYDTMLNQMVGRIKAKPGSKAEMGELIVSLDFDDDDINVHFSQDEISRVGACCIVNVKNQYVRPSNEDPLQALIQDTFLDKAESSLLLFSYIHGFTCRVYHLIILKDMDLERTKQLQKCEVINRYSERWRKTKKWKSKEKCERKEWTRYPNGKTQDNY
uniref:Uncharacterized protein n=1 Tax=Brassica oleracea var. oleracea TaxID=109376 RepID=A0A0D3C370_BRAOL